MLTVYTIIYEYKKQQVSQTQWVDSCFFYKESSAAKWLKEQGYKRIKGRSYTSNNSTAEIIALEETWED